jgi:hypothetical protein
MRADLLHVVTAISNPIRWRSRHMLYRNFERHMLESGVQLTVVECAYGDRPSSLEAPPASITSVCAHARYSGSKRI